MTPQSTIEDYKKRITATPPAVATIGYRINTVDITPKMGIMSRRGVNFHINI